jgi:predicted nucleotidyltransferase
MNILLDVSQKLEGTNVELLLAVHAATQELGVRYCIVGAFARDIILGLGYGINTGPATLDIDFGLMMDSWGQFETLRQRLLSIDGFVKTDVQHRLRYKGNRMLDILPFGDIERKPGEIAWPPGFDIAMSTIGFQEALESAMAVTIADGVSIPVVSPAALAMLKIIAWKERGNPGNRKDARDFSLLLTSYLRAGNERRLYDEFARLLDQEGFDFDAAGAHILGCDIATIASANTRGELNRIVTNGLDAGTGESLLRAIPLEEKYARRLMSEFQKGLQTRS